MVSAKRFQCYVESITSFIMRGKSYLLGSEI